MGGPRRRIPVLRRGARRHRKVRQERLSPRHGVPARVAWRVGGAMPSRRKAGSITRRCPGSRRAAASVRALTPNAIRALQIPLDAIAQASPTSRLGSDGSASSRAAGPGPSADHEQGKTRGLRTACWRSSSPSWCWSSASRAGDHLHALRPLLSLGLAYVLSFVNIGIFGTAPPHVAGHPAVNGKVLLANLALLFWLSLVPFGTGWVGQSPDADGRRRSRVSTHA